MLFGYFSLRMRRNSAIRTFGLKFFSSSFSATLISYEYIEILAISRRFLLIFGRILLRMRRNS